jgi:ketosteroid isomerase-like protein
MKSCRLWPLALMLAAGLAALSNPARASNDSEKSVRQAVAQFYSALNALFTGNLAPMTEVWSHADDITYLGPDGSFEVGWPQILENWKRQAAMKLGGRVEPAHMRITVGQELAVVENLERGLNTNAVGKNQIVLIRATSVFRKEQGQWKMIGHHTDPLSYLRESGRD